jgi:hypothetical protein
MVPGLGEPASNPLANSLAATGHQNHARWIHGVTLSSTPDRRAGGVG